MDGDGVVWEDGAYRVRVDVPDGSYRVYRVERWMRLLDDDCWRDGSRRGGVRRREGIGFLLWPEPADLYRR